MPSGNKDFSLVASGQRFEGWKSVRVSQSLEQLAPNYVLGIREPIGEPGESPRIVEGSAALLQWGGETIVDGYVDDSDSTYDATTASATVSGRAKTGDLVDCSAIFETGEWKNRTLLDIASDLCDPYGIGVSADADVGAAIRRFSIQEGETVFECIERAARMRGLLTVTSTVGDLVFARAGSRRTETVLEFGKNVVRSSRRGSWKDRFSKYHCKAQSKGDDNWFGEDAAVQKRTAKDAHITRHRPLVVLAEGQESGRELQKRADWERNVRYGKSHRLTYRVGGWECAEGLWLPNTLAHVKDPRHRLDEELLVVRTTAIRNDGGTWTDLELTRAEAFDVLTLPEKRSESWF